MRVKASEIGELIGWIKAEGIYLSFDQGKDRLVFSCGKEEPRPEIMRLIRSNRDLLCHWLTSNSYHDA